MAKKSSSDPYKGRESKEPKAFERKEKSGKKK